MPALTKSLHTVTAATNVAQLLSMQNRYEGAKTLASHALIVLSYNVMDYAADDAVVARIVKNCEPLVAAQRKLEADAAKAAA